MIRIIAKESTKGEDPTFRTFEIDAPEIEEWISSSPGGDMRRQIVGGEIMPMIRAMFTVKRTYENTTGRPATFGEEKTTPF